LPSFVCIDILTTVEQEHGVQVLSETTIVGLISDATYPHGANGSK